LKKPGRQEKTTDYLLATYRKILTNTIVTPLMEHLVNLRSFLENQAIFLFAGNKT